MTSRSQPRQRVPPTFQQLFRHSGDEDRTAALAAANDPDRVPVEHQVAICRVLDLAERIHFSRSYHATRPATDSARARVRMERERRNLVTALEKAIAHFASFPPPEYEEALATARQMAEPLRPGGEIFDPVTGEKLDLRWLPEAKKRSGSPSQPAYHWALEQLTARYEVRLEDARLFLRAVGYRGIRLSL